MTQDAESGDAGGHPLTDLELNILAGFFPRTEQVLLPVISRRITYPAHEVYPALKGLCDAGIVQVVWLGANTAYTLDLSRDEAVCGYVFYSALRTAEFRAQYPDSAQNVSRRLADCGSGLQGCIVLLSGPHAKGVAETGDAVEVVAIGDDGEAGEEKTKGAVGERLLTAAGFSSLRRKEPEYFAEILRFGFALQGAAEYFKLLYRAQP